MFTTEIIDFLKNRVSQLVKALDASATNHNNIVGRLNEAQGLVKLAESGAENIAATVEQIAKAVEPAATQTVESVAPNATAHIAAVAPAVEEVEKEVEGVLV